MYIVRIKIRLDDRYIVDVYDKNVWLELFKYKDKQCWWRIKNDGMIDFIIGCYQDRFEALEDGKKIYFNVLYQIYKGVYKFDLGDTYYETKMFHEDRGYTYQKFKENEEWFFNTKKDCADFLGLSIFEVDSGWKEYEEYEGIRISSFKQIINRSFGFLNRMECIDEECIYSVKTQEIFRIIGLSEKADYETRLLLLCRVLEKMGENKYKSDKEIKVIDDCIDFLNKSELEDSQKNSIRSMLEAGKMISSRQKCKELIKKYYKVCYKEFNVNDIFRKSYELRSKIIHGGIVSEAEVLSCVYYLKIIVLEILKEWSKVVE